MGNLKQIWKSKRLIFVWAGYNIQGRFIEAKLGLFWIILRPIFVTFIYTFVFSGLLNRQPRGGVPFVIFFLSGLTVWELIANSLMQASTSLVSKIRLMSQINFSRESIILVDMAERLVDFLVNSIVLILLSTYYGFFPTWAYLYLPIVLLTIVAFSLSGAFIIGTLSIYIRDISQITSLAIRFLFFTSGVIFSLDMLPLEYQKYIVFNPFLILVESYRGIVIYGSPPNMAMIIVLLIVSLFALGIGYKFFKSNEGTFVDYL